MKKIHKNIFKKQDNFSKKVQSNITIIISLILIIKNLYFIFSIKTNNIYVGFL